MTAPHPSAPPAAASGGGRPVELWPALSQVYVLALAGLSVAVASRFRGFLDEKFTLDANYIQVVLQIPDASLDPTDPFRNIALVYRVLGLSDSPDAAAMLALAVFGIGVLAAVRWSELARLTPVGLVTITLCYLLAMVYLAQYSKEFVSLILVVLVLLLPRGIVAELILVAAMIGYAATIRPYWAIVVGLYVVARFVLPRSRGLVPVLIFVLVTYVGLQVAINTILDQPLSFSRIAVNDLRAEINVSVGSLIVDFLPDAVGLQWLNAFLVFLSLIVPWPLILGGSWTYLVMAVVLTYLWGLAGWSIVQSQHDRVVGPARRPSGPATRAPLSERRPRPERAVALLLALVIVQAIFEPDYGSYVKHIVPVLPLFLALVPLKPRTSAPRGAARSARTSHPVREESA